MFHMVRVRALAKRILTQLSHDKRTLALMLIAPLLILTLLHFVFEGAENTILIGNINVPESFSEGLRQNNVITSNCENEYELEKGKLTAVVTMESGRVKAWIDGSDTTKANSAIKAIQAATMPTVVRRPDLNMDITYVYGEENLSLFDNFAAILMGFLVFFLVFLISGISFLKERTTGTLEKILSTPIERWEVVTGYVLGFGLVNVIQSIVISVYLVYVLKVMMVGSLWLVLLITLFTAITALTLGILVSTAANSEFQMIQFIPIIIVPQAFFTGLFTLPTSLQAIGYCMPLYYSAEALKGVMLRNEGFLEILPDLTILAILSLIFMLLNIRMLKKYRRI
ncbi:MAG: ABC transporter permease [Aminipila sp.]